MPILIGNNLFIEELPVDYNGKLLDLDPYITLLNTFFDRLEVECVRECCGIEAFSFIPEDIHKALVGLSAETICNTTQSYANSYLGTILVQDSE